MRRWLAPKFRSHLDRQPAGCITRGIRQQFGHCLLDQRVIQESQRDLLRDVEPYISSPDRFGFDLDRGLEQLAHFTPLPFRPDDAAFQPIHIEKIVHDSIQPVRSITNFARELLEHLRVLRIGREPKQFLTGRSNRGEWRFQFMGDAIEQCLAQALRVGRELDLRSQMLACL